MIVVKVMTTCVFWALMKGADIATLFVSVWPADIVYTGMENFRVDCPAPPTRPSWRKLKPSRFVGFVGTKMTPTRVIVFGPADVVHRPDATVRVMPVCGCVMSAGTLAAVTRTPLAGENCCGTPLAGKMELMFGLKVEVVMLREAPALRSIADKKPMVTV